MRLVSELTNLRPQIMTIIDASIHIRRHALQATLHVSRQIHFPASAYCNF